MRHLDLLHLPAELDRFIAPVELVRLTRRKHERNEHSSAVALALRFPGAYRTLQRGVGPDEAFFGQGVVEALPVTPLAHRLPDILA